MNPATAATQPYHGNGRNVTRPSQANINQSHDMIPTHHMIHMSYDPARQRPHKILHQQRPQRCNGNGRNEILQRQRPQRNENHAQAATTNSHTSYHMIQMSYDAARQRPQPQRTKTKPQATTTHTHHMIINDPAMAATNVTYSPTVWPQKNGLKTSFSKENSEQIACRT